MMRLKQFSKNSVNPALLFSLILATSFIFGCNANIEPTFKEKDIPFYIKKICKEEYRLEVTTQVVGKTLWVYAPLSRVLHKDFGKIKEKIFDEEMTNKLMNLMISIGRVLLSADKTPDFYCLAISDIGEKGVDYIIIGNVLDIKKSYAGIIPQPETNKRYVFKLEISPQAMGDTLGTHLKFYDITQAEFLARQIAQRIEARLREENLKNLYETKSVIPNFLDGRFIFIIDISKKTPAANTDITSEALKIISAVLRDYEFKDFTEVEIRETAAAKNISVNQKALFEDFR